MEVGDPNSCPHACMVGTLPSELPPLSQELVLQLMSATGLPCLTGVWSLGIASYCESNLSQGRGELIQCHPSQQAAPRSIIMSTHHF